MTITIDELTVSLEDFAARRGYGAIFPASFTRATAGMSKAALRRAQKEHNQKLIDWQCGRDEARAEYERLVEAGKMVTPSRMQMLKQTAAGHPDLQATQAAKRLLSSTRSSIKSGSA